MANDPTIFNIDPYYDDYDANNKFIKMLFRPGYAVQARELTQIQSILQNQISKFGDNIFQEGSIVIGGDIIENRVNYARISGLTGTLSIAETVGTVVSVPGRASAKIIHTENGLVGSNKDGGSVIFYEYVSGGTGFTENLTIGGTANNGVSVSMTILGITSGNYTGHAIGEAILITSSPGVRYTEGFFVSHDTQTIAAASITGQSGSNIRVYDNATTRIGFDVNRKFVSSEEDDTLKDPSFGFYNYAAPGADRYKINLDIKQYPFNFLDTSTTDNFSRENFIEFIRIIDGETIKKEKYPDYSTIGDTLARRTYDESGNYVVDPFTLSVTDNIYGVSGATLSAEIGSGKAYVFGYEFETQGTTKLNLPKARNTAYFEDAQISGVVGPYVYAGLNTNNGFPSFGLSSGFDVEHTTKIILSTSLGTTGASAYNPIGTASIRGVQYSGGSETNKQWRLDLFDVSMSGNNTFSQAKSIFTSNILNNGKQLFELYSPTGGASLQDFSNIMIFPFTTEEGTKKIKDVDYSLRSTKQIKFDATGTAQLTTNSIGFGTNVDKAYFDYPSGVYSPDKTFSIISISGNNVSNAYAKGSSETYGTLFITNGPTGVTATVNFEVSLKGLNGAYSHRKKQIEHAVIGITATNFNTECGPTGQTNGNLFLYLNKYIDVVNVSSITGVSGNLNRYFTLDSGQRDNYYDWSKLIVSSGYTAGDIPGISSGITCSISYYKREGNETNAPFTVDSYSESLENIPTYISRDTGNYYKLSDNIDFRIDRMSDGSFSSAFIPSNTTTNYVSLERYLPRTDKIVLTRNKEFKVIFGISDVSAPTPPDDPNSMTLYTVHSAPYTNTKEDVSIRAQANRRYTMEDIGILEKRLDAVEYYTSLNLLEQETKNTSIEDSDGLQIPKKGILVDSFRGHNISDVKDPMFNAAIDPQNTLLRPAFRSKIYRLEVDNRVPASSNISPTELPGATSDRIYTINYQEISAISQPLATTSRIVNPLSLYNFVGELKMYPSSDFWMSDTQKPTVKVNIAGERDNWSYSIKGNSSQTNNPGTKFGFGSQWNDWETDWFGTLGLDETSQQLSNKIDGNMSVNAHLSRHKNSLYTKTITPESIILVKSNIKINKDIDYYARNIYILIEAKNLKPKTNLYAFVDGETTPRTIFSIESVVESLNGTYNIQGSNSYITTDDKGQVGNGNPYYAILLNEEGKTKTGQKLIRLCDSSTNDVTSFTTCAESVFYSEGVSEQKDTDLGILGTRKSKTKRKSINDTEIDSNIFTKNTNNTAISKGKIDPLSQGFLVNPSLYPYGVFVKSISIWFKNKEESLNIPITLSLKPTSQGYPHPSKTLPLGTSTIFSDSITTSEYAENEGTKFDFSSPIYLAPGYEYAFSLSANSNNFSVHSAVLNNNLYRQNQNDPILSATKQPGVSFLYSSQSQNILSKITNEDLKFSVNICKFNTEVGSVIRITNTPSSYYGAEIINPSIVRFQLPHTLPPGTTIEIEEEGLLSSNNTPTLFNKNLVKNNITDVLPNSKFTTLYVYMNTKNQWVSPIIDMDKSCVLLVENEINNNVTGSNNDNGEESADNSHVDVDSRSKSRYITKKVNLEYPATRLDVFLTLKNPPSTSVEVFCKVLPDETDSEIYFNARGYTKINSVNSILNSGNTEFQEAKYSLTLPDKDKFSTFSIKIVMYSSSPVVVPVIQTMRVIAS